MGLPDEAPGAFQQLLRRARFSDGAQSAANAQDRGQPRFEVKVAGPLFFGQQNERA
jgi:hypothetical protein